ncbi:uncharacterized protein LOC119107389 [Pollicipes pollicipes]|uniref:uncharacterized protein LOC119107389 n=1 Tax=Pollicipes pollicipes TaxID=41117 RepID=UPI0018853360|nr:uncharacterized protein LOC119107389 [Pollicipes pollicipes]
MPSVKRARAESSSSANSGPAHKRARAVQSRVDTGLRAGAGRQAPPQSRPPLKRPPLAPRQVGQNRQVAAKPTTAPKVDSHSRPAPVTQDQLEAWRLARRQKLAERIMRGRTGGAAAAAAAAACLGMDAESRSLSTMHRSRSVNPAAAMHRARTSSMALETVPSGDGDAAAAAPCARVWRHARTLSAPHWSHAGPLDHQGRRRLVGGRLGSARTRVVRAHAGPLGR